MSSLLGRKVIVGAACLVALTLLTQAALDMAGAQAEAEGWTPRFSDDYDRVELGEN